jgi:hypothetical protein
VIVGIIVGIASLLVIIGLVLFVILFVKRKKKQKNKTKEQVGMQSLQKTQYIPISAQVTPREQTFVQSTTRTHSFSKQFIPFNTIEIQKELGKGSYGRVCLGRWNGAPVALKFCKEKEGLDEFWKEANLMMYYQQQNKQKEN